LDHLEEVLDTQSTHNGSSYYRLQSPAFSTKIMRHNLRAKLKVKHKEL